ncbi:MAG: MutS-related protein, partial [Methanosarcinaceae archaeon]
KAVVEYIHNKGRVGIRSLFATHYHQLTDLADTLKRVKNYHVAVKEDGHELVFLRKIMPGASDRSYGIHVARLAGVPHKVTKRANEILHDIENESVMSNEQDNRGRTRSKNNARYTQLILFDSDDTKDYNKSHPVLDELDNMDINGMTPLDALNALNELKKKSGSARGSAE